MMYDAQLYLINAREAQFAIINEVPFMPLDPFREKKILFINYKLYPRSRLWQLFENRA